jgi:hypothetical protein
MEDNTSELILNEPYKSWTLSYVSEGFAIISHTFLHLIASLDEEWK